MTFIGVAVRSTRCGFSTSRNCAINSLHAGSQPKQLSLMALSNFRLAGTPSLRSEFGPSSKEDDRSKISEPETLGADSRVSQLVAQIERALPRRRYGYHAEVSDPIPCLSLAMIRRDRKLWTKISYKKLNFSGSGRLLLSSDFLIVVPGTRKMTGNLSISFPFKSLNAGNGKNRLLLPRRGNLASIVS